MTGVLTTVTATTGRPDPSLLALALVFAAFVAAERFQVHVEVARDTHSISLSELPLVLGLFVLPLECLLAVRLLAAVLVFRSRRRTLRKSAFNLALFAAETGIAAQVLGLPQPGPDGWLAAYAAGLTAGLFSSGVVIVALHLLQGRLAAEERNRTLAVAVVGSVLSTTAALTVLALWQSEPRALVLVALLAAVLGVAYAAYSDLLSRHASLGEVYDFHRAVAVAGTESELVDRLLRQARTTLRADRARLRHPGEDDAVVEQVLAEGQPLLLPRGSRDPKIRAWLIAHGRRDALLVPLDAGALLEVSDRMGETATFRPADLRIAETIAAHAAVGLAHVRLLDRLGYEARHDALTGLGNRRLFVERLDSAIDALPTIRSAAVLLLDVQRFREVNDTLGHTAGDLLLCQVAQRLLDYLPPSATVSRSGGAGYAVLLPGASEARAVGTARGLRRAFEQAFVIEGLSVEVGASVGVALLPDHGVDAQTLLQRADVALTVAKDTPDAVAVYDAARDGTSRHRLALVAELRQAIDAGQLVVHYQPKIALRTGEVIGVEALVRWQHPERGLLGPDEFIGVAEATGLITPITVAVLRDALARCRSWLAEGRLIGVAVNLSTRELLDPGLPDLVAGLLRSSGVHPGLLTLEITESSVLASPERSMPVLHRLQEQGVGLSVDDFGTGYSSLSYLRRLPVNEVKIDKSFIRDLATDASSAAIVRAVVELSHDLALTVVAEGVEDEQSLTRLTELGCDSIQGYLISRPLPADRLDAWLPGRTVAGASAPAPPRLSSR